MADCDIRICNGFVKDLISVIAINDCVAMFNSITKITDAALELHCREVFVKNPDCFMTWDDLGLVGQATFLCSCDSCDWKWWPVLSPGPVRSENHPSIPMLDCMVRMDEVDLCSFQSTVNHLVPLGQVFMNHRKWVFDEIMEVIWAWIDLPLTIFSEFAQWSDAQLNLYDGRSHTS